MSARTVLRHERRANKAPTSVHWLVQLSTWRMLLHLTWWRHKKKTQETHDLVTYMSSTVAYMCTSSKNVDRYNVHKIDLYCMWTFYASTLHLVKSKSISTCHTYCFFEGGSPSNILENHESWKLLANLGINGPGLCLWAEDLLFGLININLFMFSFWESNPCRIQ